MPLHQRMYAEIDRTVNPFVGCRFDCVYCRPSFQRQKKRATCEKCRAYEPHFHLERLPKLRSSRPMLMMVPSCGDPAFMEVNQGQAIFDEMSRNPNNTYLCQSKDPSTFERFSIPANVILGTTAETHYHIQGISKAPHPAKRVVDLMRLNHGLKSLTIEPILKNNARFFVYLIEHLNPRIIWVGYDNHNCHLPEPSFAETKELIAALRSKSYTVIEKTIRKAWWEDSK